MLMINDVLWSESPEDRILLEEIFSPGDIVGILNYDRTGIVLGNLRYYYQNNDICWKIDVLIGKNKETVNPWVLTKADFDESAWAD